MSDFIPTSEDKDYLIPLYYKKLVVTARDY
jgi:hypothetical protein